MDFLNKHKKIFILVISFLCIITIILSITFRVNPTFVESILGHAVTPFQKIITGVTSSFNDKLYFLGNITKIENENKILNEKISALMDERDRLYLVEEDSKILYQLYDLDQKYPSYSKTGAYIIAKDSSNWYSTFTIDKGKNFKLDKNMVVLASGKFDRNSLEATNSYSKGGLVGRVVESADSFSKIVSIIDETSVVAAMCLRTGDIGFVKGDIELMLNGLCKMDNIDSNAKIIEGDEIVTSHLSDIYPPGIIIGYVRSITLDPKGLTKYAIIEPVVDFKHMDRVLVLDKLYTEPNPNPTPTPAVTD